MHLLPLMNLSIPEVRLVRVGRKVLLRLVCPERQISPLVQEGQVLRVALLVLQIR